MTVDLLQGAGLVESIGTGTLLNMGFLVLNLGIAIGNWRAGQKQQERLRERVVGLEDEGSLATQKDIERLRADVDRIDGYLEPLIQERLKEGRVVKFHDRAGDDDGE